MVIVKRSVLETIKDEVAKWGKAMDVDFIGPSKYRSWLKGRKGRTLVAVK